jgi:hypothetical protein
MGKTTKHQQLLLLDHDKAALLEELAGKTGTAKQVLLREAVEDLLVKHKMLRKPRAPKP